MGQSAEVEGARLSSSHAHNKHTMSSSGKAVALSRSSSCYYLDQCVERLSVHGARSGRSAAHGEIEAEVVESRGQHHEDRRDERDEEDALCRGSEVPLPSAVFSHVAMRFSHGTMRMAETRAMSRIDHRGEERHGMNMGDARYS